MLCKKEECKGLTEAQRVEQHVLQHAVQHGNQGLSPPLLPLSNVELEPTLPVWMKR